VSLVDSPIFDVISLKEGETCSYCARCVLHVVVLPCGETAWMGLCVGCVRAMVAALETVQVESSA